MLHILGLNAKITHEVFLYLLQSIIILHLILVQFLTLTQLINFSLMLPQHRFFFKGRNGRLPTLPHLLKNAYGPS